MRLHRAPRHLELRGDFGVITALKKQLDNLPLARTQANGLLLHQTPSRVCQRRRHQPTFARHFPNNSLHSQCHFETGFGLSPAALFHSLLPVLRTVPQETRASSQPSVLHDAGFFKVPAADREKQAQTR